MLLEQYRLNRLLKTCKGNEPHSQHDFCENKFQGLNYLYSKEHLKYSHCFRTQILPLWSLLPENKIWLQGIFSPCLELSRAIEPSYSEKKEKCELWYGIKNATWAPYTHRTILNLKRLRDLYLLASWPLIKKKKLSYFRRYLIRLSENDPSQT